VTAPDIRKRILFVSLKREAEPLLAQLRAARHEVSIVEDLDDAQALLASGAFDQAVLPGETTEDAIRAAFAVGGLRPRPSAFRG